MPTKFNFLDRRPGLDKIIAELKSQHPKRSDAWILNQAKQVWSDRSRR